MRTKTLLLTAALVAAGAASSMAQVYSVNAVGYVNLSIPKGFSMIGNQFVQPSYTLGTLIPNPPPSTVVYKFTPAGYLIYTFDDIDLVWYPDANGTIPLGSGVFILAPSAFSLTFVGEVPQGTLTTPTPKGFSIVSSQVPQAGTVSTLGLQGEPADVIYRYVPGAGYNIYTFDDIDLVWYPSEPSVGVGEAFFLLKNGSAANWTRTFTVN
jgi:hypothetical protein